MAAEPLPANTTAWQQHADQMEQFLIASNWRQRQAMRQFEAILCSCKPWPAWGDTSPPQAGCQIHGQIVVHPDGTVLLSLPASWVSHEVAEPGDGPDHAVSAQLIQGLLHGVHVHPELGHQLAFGRQRTIRADTAGLDRGPERAVNLPPRRYRAAALDCWHDPV